MSSRTDCLVNSLFFIKRLLTTCENKQRKGINLIRLEWIQVGTGDVNDANKSMKQSQHSPLNNGDAFCSFAYKWAVPYPRRDGTMATPGPAPSIPYPSGWWLSWRHIPLQINFNYISPIVIGFGRPTNSRRLNASRDDRLINS